MELQLGFCYCSYNHRYIPIPFSWGMHISPHTELLNLQVRHVLLQTMTRVDEGQPTASRPRGIHEHCEVEVCYLLQFSR